jgi:hypothetical protein
LLISSGKYFFLSRSCRIGKSNTMADHRELYQDIQTRFNGLWIDTHWNWNKSHPVIRLLLSAIGFYESLFFHSSIR